MSKSLEGVESQGENWGCVLPDSVSKVNLRYGEARDQEATAIAQSSLQFRVLKDKGCTTPWGSKGPVRRKMERRNLSTRTLLQFCRKKWERQGKQVKN